MAPTVNGSTHLIPAYYSIYRPRKDERLSWPSWLTYSGWLTDIGGHPSAAGRAQDRESSPARDRRSTTVPRQVRQVGKANSHRHARHDTDRTVLSCLMWRREPSRFDRQTGAFCVWSVSECVGSAVRPPDALRRRTAERTCRADSIHTT